MKETRTSKLTQLLVELFDVGEMLQFIRASADLSVVGAYLPESAVSRRAMAEAVVEKLDRRGLINPDFFILFSEHRPHRKAEIDAIALLFRVPDPSGKEQESKAILLDPHGDDLVTITVVSRRTGQSWEVTLSKHRRADHAARDIFAATILEGNKRIAQHFEDDNFRLCQGEHHYKREIVGAVVQTVEPIHIERRIRAKRPLAAAPPPPPVPSSWRRFSSLIAVLVMLYVPAVLLTVQSADSADPADSSSESSVGGIIIFAAIIALMLAYIGKSIFRLSDDPYEWVEPDATMVPQVPEPVSW